MARLNKVMIIGNIGHDPEGKFTPDGLAIVRFSVALNYGKEQVMWLNVVAFGKLGERTLDFAQKGTLILLEGELGEDIWKDDDGKEHRRVRVIANNIQFLDRMRERDRGDRISEEDKPSQQKQQDKKAEEPKDAESKFPW